ncbi:MAG: L,D-transpeptidase family protein [Steroidobacteraceae bacterium]
MEYPRPFALSVLLCLLAGASASAATYPLPAEADSVVGEIQYVVTRYEDTLLDIGRRFGIGYEEIVNANPGVDAWVPGTGVRVTIPSRFILPDAPREGIVVNLPEHRLYYFPKPKAGEPAVVQTYPVSVGKEDWTTPVGVTRVVDKRVRPTWYPPESVRAEHAAQGRFLAKAVPPGPDNPLGEFAMRLGLPGGAYLIHGTNKPTGVGMPVTHGCIRMFPEDIENVFQQVPVNTTVRILHQPSKMGWLGDNLYLEVHGMLEGQKDPETYGLTQLTRAVVAATKDRPVQLDWKHAEQVFAKATGVPEPLSHLPPVVASTESGAR